MNVLFASSEVYPFAKTGGLADVGGALPIALQGMVDNVTVILPAFRHIYKSGLPIEELPIYFDVPVGGQIASGQLLKSYLPNSDVPIYFVKNDEYFDRPELYREAGTDYQDNCERFVFFCRSVLEAIRLLDLKIDLLHCNDWQTGLIPAYLNIEYRATRGYEDIASVLTIHNMAYQGNFWHWDMLLTGLDWKYFNMHQMEFYGHLNFLKTGIVFADAITTVSPRYAEEIQSQPMGCGLEGALRERRSVLEGIVNGVDYTRWNPATDDDIASQYDVTDWQKNKPMCKEALQREFHLPTNPKAPVIGMVGRMADQKGFDLVAKVIRDRAKTCDCQWVILGTGEPHHEAMLKELSALYPNKIGVKVEFCEGKARRVEAGADMFLMPSLYEPCGLNQLYSLKYGTVPVVRETGGLADTITNMTPATLESGTANGFSFREYTAEALQDILEIAITTYQEQPETWKQIVETGMAQDWSWDRSAQQYIELYQKTIEARRNGQCRFLADKDVAVSSSSGNELRRDPLLGFQVVVAEGRESRPQQWKSTIPAPSAMRCPFCGGHEDATPHERLALPANLNRQNDKEPWEVRVLPNIYPSLSPHFPDSAPAAASPFFESVAASGIQEVIVESPQHVRSFTQLPEQNAILTFQAYQMRLNAIREEGRCRYVQLFKNNGPAAGASLEHSHSQLMATRYIPPIIEQELAASSDYFQKTNRSFWSDLIESELAEGTRIVHADDQLVAFCPYASRMPFEVTILPRVHQADFGKANSTLLEQLALLLRSILVRVEKALNFPAYNYLIHTLPFDTFSTDHYHWHVEVLPRVTVRAGFEWGTGLYVNPLSPERAARILRESL